MNTLYDNLGGANAIDAAVGIFYQKVLANNDVSLFFADTNMKEQIEKQKGFLTYAFGGPHHYSGKNMRVGHAHLISKGLNDSHVDIIIQLLGETLSELKVDKTLIDQVAAIANSVRSDVLNL